MSDTSKYRQIFEDLQKAIRDGQYPKGVPLPSEEALVRRYDVSRITAANAMAELVKRGLVYRRRGSGTFATRKARHDSGRLGLIMPSLSLGEIFPLICQEIVQCAQSDGYSTLIGDTSASSPEARARKAAKVARAFVQQGVAGVILQPLAFLASPERVTREIISLFDRAEVPVVLIDRDIDAISGPVRHDFVGIDNFAAGRTLCVHLLECGAKRVHFLMRPNCASIIRDRLDGVASVLGERRPKNMAIVAEPDDAKALSKFFRAKRGRPDAVVCESDYVAAVFRNTLAKLGVSVPQDVMLVGFDDVRFAVTSAPTLTTVHQPCADIAHIAYNTLRERIADSGLPPRRILLPAPLVVRESSGKMCRLSNPTFSAQSLSAWCSSRPPRWPSARRSPS